MALANEVKNEVDRNCCTLSGNFEERDQMEEKSKLHIVHSVHCA